MSQSDTLLELIIFFQQQIRREKILKIAVSLFLIWIGLIFLFYFGRGNSGLVILSLLLSVTGLKFLSDVFRTNKDHDASTLIPLLSQSPCKIVWVYSIVTENMPFGIHLIDRGKLLFKLDEGKEICISVPHRRLKEISRQLQQLLPHASFGYTKEKMQWYLADPHLLYKSSDNNPKK